jgi:hypothetical protein
MGLRRFVTPPAPAEPPADPRSPAAESPGEPRSPAAESPGEPRSPAVESAGEPRSPAVESPGEPPSPPGERCELCGAGIGDRHGHVVSLDDRSLRCACRPCHLLFHPRGAGGGRFRAVPERYLTDPAHRLTAADWDLLQIPVSTAFFFANSDLDRVICCYPSPAGATECTLDLAEWEELRGRHRLLAAPDVDVEAVYVTRTGDGIEAFLIPIDACYALVGEVRLRWRGLDGGDDIRRVLTDFADDLRARSRPLP